MNDRNKESLSALMDGEADELEIRRILNQLDNDESLREHWKNYHLMGSLMRDESHDSLDLTQGINNVLDGKTSSDTAFAATDTVEFNAKLADGAGQQMLGQEDLLPLGKKSSRFAFMRTPLTSVAVAASVTLAVLLGVQSIDPSLDPSGLGLQSPAELASSDLSQQQEQLLTQQQQDVLENAQQQLQEYVLQQSSEKDSERSGMLPFARVVEFEGQSASK